MNLAPVDLKTETISGSQKAKLLALYVLLVALRYPWLLLHGRLWAEEGPVYLRGAWLNSFPSALFAAHIGYYALWPNCSALFAARILPLRFAALGMTWCAFLVQILAGYLIVECETFSTIKTKMLALLVLLLAAPSFEVWLNTINSQFYLAVCAVIVFLSRADRHRIQRNVVLALAAFTGPMTAFLTPFFLLRAFLLKTKGAALQAGVLTTCAFVQVAAVLESMHAGARQINFKPSGAAPEFLVEYIAIPFFSTVGKKLASSLIMNQTGNYLLTSHTASTHLLLIFMRYHLPLTWPFLLMWAIIDLAFITALVWITSDRSDRSSWWLLAMSLWLAMFSIYGSLRGTYDVADRYVFPSAVLIGISLMLAGTRTTARRAQKIAAKCLLACFLLAGAVEYLSYPRWIAYMRPPGPGWYTQVQQWEQNPHRTLSVWPRGYGRRVFSLSSKPQ